MTSCLMSVVDYQSKENFGLQLAGAKMRLLKGAVVGNAGVATTVPCLKYRVHFPVINSNTLSEAHGTCYKRHRIMLCKIILYATRDRP